jgi:hypothetical protein
MDVLRGGALALAALSVGCAYARGGLVGQSDRVLRASAETRPDAVPQVDVVQDGPRLSITASQRCVSHRVEVVETTSRYGRESTMGGLVAGIGIVGGLAVVGGSLLAANVFGFPPEALVSPTDDGLTAESALISGVVLIGAGAIGLVVAAIHAFGLLGTEETRAEQVVDRGPSGEARVCEPRIPMVRSQVTLLAAGDVLSLGSTDDGGALHVDELDARFVLEHAGVPASIRVGGQDSGAIVSFDPWVEDLETRVFARAETTRCAAAERAADCTALERYLSLFPNGANADQARAVLAGAQARLAERATRVEEQRRLEEERRRAEAEAWRIEQEREERARQAQWEREVRERQAELEARRQSAEREAEARRARNACHATCRSTCAADARCEQSCRASRCR